jgi:hypothetical protein
MMTANEVHALALELSSEERELLGIQLLCTLQSSEKRDANGNTIDVEFNPNPPTHLCMHTGGQAAEDLAPPTNSNPARETRVQQVC